jgi:uncharacterized protein with HEPN domain
VRHDEDRLRDILEAIDAIRSRAGSGRSAFDADAMLRVWCLHHLTIIGEAASRLSEELRQRHSAAPWRDIIGMRNAVVHGYFDVDWDEVWAVVDRDLVPLRAAVEVVLHREEGES